MIALVDWVEEVIVGSDSKIALAWKMYKKMTLNVYHQNRVINISQQVDLNKLFWIQGTEILECGPGEG